MVEIDEEVVTSLKKIGKGSVLVLLGMGVYQLSNFLFRVFLARGLPVPAFGEVSFGLSLVTVGVVVALLGLFVALPREMAYHRRRARELATSGVLLTLLSSLFLFSLLYFLSPLIPIYFPGISREVFMVFSFSIIFVALLRISVAVGRGFEDVMPAFWFYYILPSLGLLLTGYLVLTSFHEPLFPSVSYMATFALSSLLALLYTLKRGYVYFRLPQWSTMKKLLLFSSPLFLSTFLWNVFSRMDVFMLGYFLGSVAVGIYSAAATLVRAIPFFLTALNFLYLPIATSLVVKRNIKSLNRLYQVITKWVTVTTVPIFLVALLFPRLVLRFFFSSEYLQASTPLLILAVAFGIHSSLGANGLTVLALGDNTFILVVSLVASFLNLLFNLYLIPLWGVSGAALATAVSLITINAMHTLYLYRKYGIQPFTKKYFLPYVISAVLLLPLKLFDIHARTPYILLLVLLIYLPLYTALLLLFRIYDEEDRRILKLLLRRLRRSI